MTHNTYIIIDNAEISVDIDFELYKEDGVKTIVIDSIRSGTIRVGHLVDSTEMEALESKLETVYENANFWYWEDLKLERETI